MCHVTTYAFMENQNGSDIKGLTGRAQNCCIQKKKCIEYVENFPFMAIFLHNLYIFVWIKQDCFANMVFALDLSNSVMMFFSFFFTFFFFPMQ